MTVQNLLSPVRRALTDYNMIKEGDSVVVGLSGGKDSLALLTALSAYRRFSPQSFRLGAITIDLGAGADYAPLTDYCKALDVDYHIERTDIFDIIFNVRKEKNPCSLCSKMRRGALNTTLISRGYNVLALGHHADDLVETMLLSLCYEGRLSTFAPVSFMDKSGVTMIRPLVYTFEKDIAAFAKDLPVVFNPCPANHETQREYMKNLISHIGEEIPFAKKRMHSALTHPERNNLWGEDSKRK